MWWSRRRLTTWGIGYGTYRDTVPREEYLRWTVEWCSEVKRLLKDNGSFFLNIGAAPSNPMLPHEVVIAFEFTSFRRSK